MSGKPMATELVPEDHVIIAGRAISTNKHNTQNSRVLPILDLLARHTVWAVESGSNNMGSVVTEADSKTCQIFLATMKRMWGRAIKFNGSVAYRYEDTHPVQFPKIDVIQGMPNTPLQHMAYLLWRGFNTLVGQQSTNHQTFVDKSTIEQFSTWLVEVEEYINTEIGNGEPIEAQPGFFATGEGMPDYSIIGVLEPGPLVGPTLRAEPSADLPPSNPSDVPDRR